MMDEVKWNGMGWEGNYSIDLMGRERRRVSELVGK
jgi:hypothetical protein